MGAHAPSTGGGSLPVAAGASGNVGDVTGVVYQTPGVFVVGGDKDTPLNGNGAVLTDAFAQWNGNGAALKWSGNGTDGEQSLLVNTDVGQTVLHDADGNMSPAGTVIDLPDPTNAQDAATKAYVDTKAIPKGGPLTENLDADGNDLLHVSQITGSGVASDLELSSGANARGVHISSAGVVVGLSSGNEVGFFGTFPVSQPTGVAVDVAAIHAALVTLGLITA